MVVSDNSYSRLIAWLKILLPLAALAILSSLFLVSKPRAPPITQLPPDQIVGEATLEPHISDPSLSGVTLDGMTYSLHAKLVTPSGEQADNLTLSGFAGTLTGIDGFQLDISAPKGVIKSLISLAIFSQGVRVVTSDGYDIQTDELWTDFANAVISTPGAIQGIGPMGQFSAGQMTLQQQNNGTPAQTFELVFKNGVKVLYQPGR